MKTVKERFEAKTDKTSYCWNWTAYKDRRGYGNFRINRRTMKAHRVAWVLYIGEIPDEICCLHHCDNPSCVNPSHLFLGTYADNAHDCMNKRRGFIGEKNGNAKLTEDQVKTIRKRHNDGIRGIDISREFNVTDQAIYHIILGHSWKNV